MGYPEVVRVYMFRGDAEINVGVVLTAIYDTQMKHIRNIVHARIDDIIWTYKFGILFFDLFTFDVPVNVLCDLNSIINMASSVYSLHCIRRCSVHKHLVLPS